MRDVAPLAGAWVEIVSYKEIMPLCVSRSPRGSVG